MTEAGKRPQEVFYGIRLSDLSQERLKDISEIYFNVAQTPEPSKRYPNLDDVSHVLKFWTEFDLKIASKKFPYSRLLIQRSSVNTSVVSFGFDANMAIEDLELARELEEKQREFRRATSDYLEKTGLGVALEQR